MSIMVTLTPEEMEAACILGVRRRLSSLAKGHRERYGADKETVARQWFSNILGAMGEAAAAKALGLTWQMTIDVPKQLPDILPDWQVRTAYNRSDRLVVRDDDSNIQRFVLVTGIGPEFVVHGWAYGVVAKQRKWLADYCGRGTAVYWVPQAALRPLLEPAMESN